MRLKTRADGTVTAKCTQNRVTVTHLHNNLFMTNAATQQFLGPLLRQIHTLSL